MIIEGIDTPVAYPKNQKIYVQSEQTKHVADLSVQSKLKKVDDDLLSGARRVQKYLFAHTGQTSWWPFTSTVWGSFLPNNFIVDEITLNDGFITV